MSARDGRPSTRDSGSRARARVRARLRAGISSRRRTESGLAVPVVLGLGGVLLSFCLGGLVGGQVLVAQRRAASAADLAALAGAVTVQVGRDGCEAARRLLELGDATLEDCRIDGEQVRVTAGVPLSLAGHQVTVRARAHAGPREVASAEASEG